MTDENRERCRLVLVTPDEPDAAQLKTRLEAAVNAGDVASVIIPKYGMDDAAYQALLEALAPVAQGAGAAAIAVDDTRAFGRTGADGIHIGSGPSDLQDAVERFQAKAIVGAGSAETRHKALELGEARPDYIFFGRLGQDTHAEPHRKNLDLAEWWASFIEIPCIVMAGADLSSVEAAAATGAEFVALSRAVLGPEADPAAAVAKANAILEDYPLDVDA